MLGVAGEMQRTVWPAPEGSGDTVSMSKESLLVITGMLLLETLLLVSGILLLCPIALAGTAPEPGFGPGYTADDRLQLPKNYREWVYLSSGFDMSYNPALRMGHHMFDNVFVQPAAYKTFIETGTWPDKTLLVLEARMAKSKGSINQSGNFQGDVMALEVHVKDMARFSGKWAFFAFNGEEPAIMLPQSAECYACHAAHAAVDTTFVQFYPTLLPIAQALGTTSLAYRQDISPKPQR